MEKIYHTLAESLDKKGLEAKEISEKAMEDLRKCYSTLNSLSSAISRLKNRLYLLEIRHPEYKSNLEILKDDNVLNIGEIQDFENLSLKEQVVMKRRKHLTCPWLNKINVLPDVLLHLHLSKQESEENVTNRELSLIKSSSNVIKLRRVDMIISKCRKIIREATTIPIEILACSIAILTGRRQGEILKSGTMTPCVFEPYTIYFSGQLKTNETGIIYEIPVMDSALQIVKAFNILRERISKEGACSHKKLAKEARCILDVEGSNFHTLRCAYTVISFELFKPHDYSINAWGQKVLGHNGINTSTHYTKMQVEGIHRIRRNHMLL